MALQQVQDTSENEITIIIFPRFSCTFTFTQDGMIRCRTSVTVLSESPHAETGPCKPDELVVGVMRKTVGTPQEETGNRYPEKLIITHIIS